MTTPLQIGDSKMAAVKFYDGLPDGGGNPTGNEVVLGHAATWGTSPSGKLTVTPVSNQAVTLTGAAVSADVTVTATDPTSGVSATYHIQVTVAPTPPDPPQPDPLPPVPPGPDILAQEEASSGNGSGDGWWGPQNPLEPIFPLNPSLGYVPPTPNPPSNPPPAFALWGFDNGLVALVRNS